MKQHITRTQVYYAEEVGTMFIDAADNLSAAVDKRERRTRFNNLRKRLPELKEHELVHIALGANAAGELVVLACYETHAQASDADRLAKAIVLLREGWKVAVDQALALNSTESSSAFVNAVRDFLEEKKDAS